MNNIKEILAGTYDNKILRRRNVHLFLSNPGLGKTSIIEQFAKSRNARLISFIVSGRNPTEISGIAMPDKKIRKMTYWDFDVIENLKDGDILFFDEVMNGNPAVLSACLTLLEARVTISNKKLPDIMIVAAANPQGMCPLTPQIKERFIWNKITFDKDIWYKDFMYPKYRITTSILNQLACLINDEKFTGYNFNTPRSIDKAIENIIYNIPSPYEKRLLPILSTMIKNPFNEEVQLSKNKVLRPNEMIPYIDILKYKYGTIKE